jgi:hypothetical protein
MLCTEYWALDCEAFRGGWILADCGDGHPDNELRVCVARLAVVRVAANAVGRQLRGEDLRDDVAMTREYLAALEIDPCRRRGLLRVLDALVPFDPACLAEELLSECAASGRAALDGSARTLAELAYDAALSHDLHATAQGAALALARLAVQQECPRSARKWQALSTMHGRRAARARVLR